MKNTQKNESTTYLSDASSISNSSASLIDNSPNSSKSFFIEKFNLSTDDVGGRGLAIIIDKTKLSASQKKVFRKSPVANSNNVSPQSTIYNDNSINTHLGSSENLLNPPFVLGHKNGTESNSTGTVSTNFLLSDQAKTNSDKSQRANSTTPLSLKYKRTASNLRQSSTEVLNSNSKEDANSNVLKPMGSHKKFTSNPSDSVFSFEYDTTLEPNIEQAVQLLKNEMTSHKVKSSRATANSDSNISDSMETSSNSKRSSPLQETVSKFKNKSPLLNKFLFFDKPNTSSPNMPKDTSAEISRRNSTNSLNSQAHLDRFVPLTPVLKSHAQITTPTSLPSLTFANDRSETMEDNTNSLFERYEAINDINFDLEANANLFETMDFDENDIIDYYKTLPIQHIDSNSIYSFDTEISGFFNIYSMSRITLLFAICILAPPLFFIIGISGSKKQLLSNEKLMKMVMKKNHRIGMLKGFQWDVDVSWLRRTMLLLGIMECLAIFACVGIGFGVGITHEHMI